MDQIPPQLIDALALLLTAVAGWIGAKVHRKKRHGKVDDGSYRQVSEVVHTRKMLELMQRQHGVCAISGVPLTESNASIERLYGRPGEYDNGSVRLVDRDIKRLKGDWPDDKFLKICKKAVGIKEDGSTISDES